MLTFCSWSEHILTYLQLSKYLHSCFHFSSCISPCFNLTQFLKTWQHIFMLLINPKWRNVRSNIQKYYKTLKKSRTCEIFWKLFYFWKLYQCKVCRHYYYNSLLTHTILTAIVHFLWLVFLGTNNCSLFILLHDVSWVVV